MRVEARGKKVQVQSEMLQLGSSCRRDRASLVSRVLKTIDPSSIAAGLPLPHSYEVFCFLTQDLVVTGNKIESQLLRLKEGS